MKTYRRILVPIDSGSRGAALLKRAAEIAQTDHAEVMVVKVIDTRGGFESDGPLGSLPMERAARKKPAERQRLDLMLARSKLSWAESRVICGEPAPVLADTIRQWRPDLIVIAASLFLPGWITSVVAQSGGVRPDVLTVVCGNPFSRLARTVFPRVAHQAHQ